MNANHGRAPGAAGRPPLFHQLAPLLAHWSLTSSDPRRPAPQSIDPADPGIAPAGGGPGSAQLSALHWAWRGRLDVAPYASGWHQVAIRLGGNGRLVWREGGAPVDDAGEPVAVIPAGVDTGFTVDGELDLMLLCLSPGRLQAQAEADGWHGPEPSAAPSLSPAFAVSDGPITGAARLIAANREIFALSSLFRDSIERLLAVRILECFSDFSPPPADPPPDPTPEEPRVAAAMTLLAEDLTVAPSIDDLAAAAGLPAGRFLQVFKALAGRTPQAYQAALRISAARRLIVETTLPFGEIARRTGYPSQAALSMACRRQYGASPRAIRSEG
ncbi:MAG: helix-turn-helix transcriptional regulator [Pseudomonadota bacterium]